jgi:hypothetical protein
MLPGVWHVHDIGSTIRVIFECSHDIDFMFEGLMAAEFPVKHQEILDQYFSVEIKSKEELIADMKKDPQLFRKNVYPAVGRVTNPRDPDGPQRVAKAVEEVYSGYIHASYPAVMEIYEGISQEFKVEGIASAIPHWPKYLGLAIYQVLTQFAILAKNLNLMEIKKELDVQMDALKKSDAYPAT